MYNFCTYFDRNYLPQAKTLYDSLEEQTAGFCLFALCLDDDSFTILNALALPKMVLIPLKTLEDDYPELLEAKSNRSRVEYFFTLSPALPLYIFKNHLLDMITYLDSDLYFFADPKVVFEEIGDASVAIISHRLFKRFDAMLVYGIFNVGWISFRRDSDGLNCLTSWYEQCISWCYKRLENGKFADQKYLDEWPERFKNVRIIEHKGANTAPWNIENYIVTEKDNKAYIDNQKLIFFHFHGLKRYMKGIYSVGYKVIRITSAVRHLIYFPYVNHVNRNIALMNNILVDKNLSVKLLTQCTVFSGKAPFEKIKQYFSLLYRQFVSGNYVKVEL